MSSCVAPEVCISIEICSRECPGHSGISLWEHGREVIGNTSATGLAGLWICSCFRILGQMPAFKPNRTKPSRKPPKSEDCAVAARSFFAPSGKPRRSVSPRDHPSRHEGRRNASPARTVPRVARPSRNRWPGMPQPTGVIANDDVSCRPIRQTDRVRPKIASLPES